MNRRGILALAGIGALASMPRAMAQTAPPANVRTLSAASFGARGDGQTDDTAALQKALDETFKGNDGTFLTIPPGVYRVDRTLRISPAHHMTHASGILADGYVDAIGNVVCPVHRYRFSIRNGRNSEGYFLKVYVVERREDGVYVRV